MSDLEGLWLGVVQGLTEFLPVSSSGHLVMARRLLGVETGGGILFEVAVHLASLLAIVLFYRQRIGALVVGVIRREPAACGYGAKLALATLPAVVVGLFFADLVEAQFARPRVTGVGLLATGAILWTTRRSLPLASGSEPTLRAALLIGCAQALAILPGVSRSGTTVAVALALGIAPLAAAEFSFLLGVVAISGAALLMLPGLADASPQLLSAIALGAVAALVSGLAALWLFVRLLRGRRFYWFAWYAWVVGAGFLGWLQWGGA